ncbi:MAG: DUF3553 domain-containing protein [Phycisphaerales bacterium]|nr:DUF3553 domain-containing protein [Phycisphaerales bacterium]
MSLNNGVDRCVTFEFGDRVRMTQRPEWGVGAITRVENVPIKGEMTQSLTVRFPNAGMKTLNGSVAKLERVEAEQSAEEPRVDRISGIDRIAEDEMLAGLADRKLKEVMLAIPEQCSDPFRTLESRLQSTLDLFRFDQGGRGLMDWSVAQTGLDDPLSRFNRLELEQHFERWACERDAHLNKLLREARESGLQMDALLAKAPPAAVAATRRGR